MAEDIGMLGNLLQNKLFLQMLSSAGADLSQGTGGTNLNAAVQGNIASQNFSKLLKTLLGSDGTKATFSNTGMNLTIPKETEMFKSLLSGQDPFSGVTGPPQASPTTPPSSTSPSVPQGINLGGMYGTGQGGVNIANPFVEGQSGSAFPELSGADLAGLTPQSIMGAIGLKQAQDQMRQQSFKDMIDMNYKNAVLQRETESARTDKEYKQALIDKAKADIENDRPIYQTEEGLKLNAKDYIAYQKLQKDDQPAAVKMYEYAQKQGYKGSFVEFQDNAKTTHKKDYDEAVKSGYKGSFNTWMTEMAKAGAINLGDLMKKESELTKLQGEKYFSNPDWTKDLQGFIGSKDIQNRIDDIQVPDLGPDATKEQKQAAYRTAAARERAKVKIEFIEGKIAAGGGKVIEDPVMNKDGKTVTWKVQWPSGSVTTVTQAVR